MSTPKLIVILGPTASGKTQLAVQLANQLNGAIISADSRQVYRGMDIGTGKDLDEYNTNAGKVDYHLIDIVDAGEKYHLYQFQKDFIQAFNNIQESDKTAILCGGSGLYIEAALGLHPYSGVPINDVLRSQLLNFSHGTLIDKIKSYDIPQNYTPDTSTHKRCIRAIEILDHVSNNEFTPLKFPKFKPVIFGLNPDRELRRARISKRLTDRLNNGMIEEVQTLLDTGVSQEALEYYGLEYKFITQYLTESLNYDEMKERLETAIHRFAKRQMTFFRKMEKSGLEIHWLSHNNFEIVNKKITLSS